MNLPTQIDAITKFLQSNTHDDLAKLYNPEMEVQVLVAQDDGQRVESEYKSKLFRTYTNGLQTWKSFRIPYDADTNPHYDINKLMTYDLSLHVEGIGLTGWNWQKQQSEYVAFDFDALTGHSLKHSKRLNEQQLNELINYINQIPYTTLRRSTSGKGLHLYIFLSPTIYTDNHTMHAALARSILGQLSVDCNHDFTSKVDTCGGVLWIWHRKMLPINETEGLTLVKKGIPLNRVPANWEDHLPVITGRKQKSLPQFISDPETNSNNNKEQLFDELTGQRIRIKLDNEHHKLIDFLKESKFTSYWDAERWMLVTHTFALKEAHFSLSLKGKYDTISEGSDPLTQNCFCFPLANGAWVIRRFSLGVAEAPTWEQDNHGWSKCYLNSEPNLFVAARIHGGMEHKSGGYVFNDLISANKAAKELGIDFELPGRMEDRKVRIKQGNNNNTNKLIVEVEADPRRDNSLELDGWYHEGKWWQRIFHLNKPNTNQLESEIYNYDDTIRHVVSEDGKDLGWYAKSEDGSWHNEPLQHIKAILEGPYQYNNRESKHILGSNIIKPWILINRPFQHEYPGGRIWNKDAAQLRFYPSGNPDHELKYPTWQKILSHIGRNLNQACQENEYCKKNGILTGSDYLRLWIASIFQQPTEHLPYLFLYSPEQNTGKSTFHEALSLLITKGYIRADSSLTSSSNFNGELDGCLLAIIEETDLRKNKIAAARINDWTTAQLLPIHAKQRTPYLVQNTIHFIQVNNNFDACPIFGNDTRITMIKVDPFDNDNEPEIPKRELIIRLEKEAPDFIQMIKTLELPNPIGRLNIPILNTQEKQLVQESNQTPLEDFLKNYCHYSPGKAILYSELYNKFKEQLDPQEVIQWSIRQFGKHLPPHFPKGRLHGKDPNYQIGNLSFTPPTEEDLKKARLVRVNDYLELETMVNNNGQKEISTK